MNLYVQRRGKKIWPHLMDAEGNIVGVVKPEVADWLVRSKQAMDLR